MDGLFRPESLEGLRSRENLEESLRIASPRSWIALITVCLLVASGLVWGIWGRIATTVDGMGMLMDPRGVLPVVATLPGRLIAIHVQANDLVTKDQVIATLVNPDTEKRLEAEKLTYALLKAEYAKASELMKREIESKRHGLQAQRKSVQSAIKVQENQAKWLQDRLGAYSDLFEKGLVLKKQVVETGLQRDNALLEIDKLKGDLLRLSSLETQEEEALNEKRFRLEFQIEQSKSRVEILANELKRTTTITAPFAGTIISLEGTQGGVVEPGQALATMMPQGGHLEARILVPALQGKQIRIGMILQVTPSTVKREEYGFMSAKVKQVGDFPVSPESINRLINNPELVQAAMRRGAMVQVKGDLITDPSTLSGYRWSSRKGRSVPVTAGTLCSSEVIVKEVAPITLVIPMLKAWIGD